jgi:TRAP-type mannitol/chloroaromatic compound transport system permease small subunit
VADYSLIFLSLEGRIERWKQIGLASHVCGLLLWFSAMLLGILQDVSSLGGIMEAIHQIQINTNFVEPFSCIAYFARIFY